MSRRKAKDDEPSYFVVPRLAFSLSSDFQCAGDFVADYQKQTLESREADFDHDLRQAYRGGRNA